LQVKRILLGAVLLGLASCATGGAPPPMAPQPLKPLDAAFFTGRWYEITRTPNFFTNGCVAGTTDFVHGDNGQLIEQDECRKGTPEGATKTFRGSVEFLNPPADNKFTVHYTLYGFVPFAQTYWVLDHAPDYAWFIVSNPSFQNVAILDRAPRSSPALVAELTARLKAMGYDTSKLEFPVTFPPGQG
jgi:apolipoprotein D and lipocalin family protein